MKKFSSIVLSIGILASGITNVAQASSITYTVEKGDTLYKIATKHNMTVTELKEINNLTDNVIEIHQKLVITKDKPLNGLTDGTQSISTNTTSAVTTQKTYTVVKGDTLSKIARSLDVTVAALKQLNDLKTDQIHVGQALIYIGATNLKKTTQTSKSLSLVNQQIETQLFKEKAITQLPSKNGQIKYDRVVHEAKKILGTRYVFGGSTAQGIDCSGLIYFAFNKAGYEIPRLDTLNYFMDRSTKVENPVPGDLLFFKNTYRATISHMGIYLGNNQFIHASTSQGVTITSLNNSYWKERFVAFKRFNVVQ